MSSFCCCDQCHTLSYLTDSYRWVCGLVSAVDFAFLCMATDSIARRRPRFARALRQGPCSGHGCGACVWDVVFRHGTCVTDTSAHILGEFSLGIVDNEANGKVKVVFYCNPGEEAFRRKRQGPFAGPAHDSSVFDSVRLLQQLARNKLDLVGGSDIGICRHAKIHEPICRFTVTEQATTHPCHTSHVIAFAWQLFSREAQPPPV